MSAEKILAIVGVIIVLITLTVVIFNKLPKRLKTSMYIRKWRDIQKLCARSEDWSHAIIHADTLLDEVLRKRKVPGKTMGERMVNAQSRFTSNDSLWSAHKLANKVRQNNDLKLKDTDVKEVLTAYRQSLRDLGAF